jgi:hypothetical protein
MSVRYANLAPVSVDTLVVNMEGVTKAVEGLIGEDMPDEFGIMLDGWTHGAEHYLAVFACWDTPDGPRRALLSMSPIMDEPDDHLGAEGHLIAIERFLPFFGKTIEGCKFIVGDNCSVNKRLATIMGVPLVGCASHRLQLAVRDYLLPYEAALEEVQTLMRKLRTLKQAAKLRYSDQNYFGICMGLIFEPTIVFVQSQNAFDARFASGHTMVIHFCYAEALFPLEGIPIR